MTSNFNLIVIVSENTQLLKELSLLLTNRNYTYAIENSSLKSLTKIIDTNVLSVIVDLDSLDENSLDFITAIKKTRPRIPIVTVSHEMTLARMRELVQRGVFYCGMSPIQPDEFDQVLNAIQKHTLRQNAFE